MAKKKTEEHHEEKTGGLADVIKKVASIGIGAAFMTEDTIRGIVKDLPIPKDFVTGLVDNAKQQKSEVINSVKGEFKKYLNQIDPSKEIQKILENYEIKVDATLNFKKKDTNKDNN